MNRILLLNLNYEPLYVCSLSRAMKLLIMGKAETLHFKDDTYFFTGAGQQYQVPSVIRLKYNIKKKGNPVYKVSKEFDSFVVLIKPGGVTLFLNFYKILINYFF